jgi:cell wall-associated NlpC family hydrolase
VSERVRTTKPQQVPDETERSAALIELLLVDPKLRASFRADPGPVLRAHGLGRMARDIGNGPKALVTLELRESRSSLAGAMIAAAAEGVDMAHVAEHVAPLLGHDAGHAFQRLMKSFSHHTVKRVARAVKPEARIEKTVDVPPLRPQPKPTQPTEYAGAATPPAAPSEAAGTTYVEPQTSGTGVQAQSPVQGSYGAEHASTAPGQTATAAPGSTATGSGQPAAPAGSGGTETATGSGTPATTPVDPTHARGGSTGVTAEPPETPGGTSLTYPGNDATPQQLAAWMGTQAQQAGLPPELPVMAALTESGLRNVPYGTDDSVGFFQMRLGIWNTGQYAGYLQNPELQLEWFIQHALAAKAEDPSLAGSPSTWGEWIANIEQPAAQFRYRYQLQLQAAQQLLGGADLTPVAAAPTETVGQEALSVAMRYMGTPYVWGGSSPATGFDCSGLVQWSYDQAGIHLPRTAAEQFDVGVPVSRNDLQPGDAVFFEDPNGFVHHVGLYIGDGKFIDSPETGQDVRIDSLSEPYFAEQYAGARQFTAASLGNPASYARTMPTVSGS